MDTITAKLQDGFLAIQESTTTFNTKKHFEDLLLFPTKELTELQADFKKYCDKIITIKRVTGIKSRIIIPIAKRLVDSTASIHPYFSLCPWEILLPEMLHKIILWQFNKTQKITYEQLNSSSERKKFLAYVNLYCYNLFIKKIGKDHYVRSISNDYLTDYANSFYDKLLSDLYQSQELFETNYIKRTSFYPLIQLQKEVTRVLDWIFNIDISNINQLDIEERYKYYIAAHINDSPIFTQQLPATVYNQDILPCIIKDVNMQLDNLFNPESNNIVMSQADTDSLLDLLKCNSTQTNDTDQLLIQIQEEALKISAPMFDCYQIENITDVLQLELYLMYKANTKLRVCRNCSRYFIYSDGKRFYCDRIVANNSTCRTIGPRNTYKKKVKSNPILHQYENFIAAQYTRYSRRQITLEELDESKRLVKEKYDKLCTNEMEQSSYLEWFNDFEKKFRKRG